LTAYSGVRVLAPTFYALRDTRIPMMASLLSILTNYAVASFTVNYLGIGHRGLALSISIVAIINFLLLFYFMRRKLSGIEGRALGLTFLKVLSASMIMGAVSWTVSHRIQNLIGRGSLILHLIDVGVSIVAGMISFYIAARLLRVTELDQITDILRRKLGRAGR
jgi:putative peptidoglycan lipid II flippase